jgi:hypothetical protein
MEDHVDTRPIGLKLNQVLGWCIFPCGVTCHGPFNRTGLECVGGTKVMTDDSIPLVIDEGFLSSAGVAVRCKFVE